MVIPLGLSAADQTALTDTLLTHHTVNVAVDLLDLSGNRLSTVSDRLLSGQVNIDWSAEITRTCTMSLLDPSRTLTFDSNSPEDGAVFLDRMFRVTYSVLVGSTWRDIPVFTGPVSSMSRDDDVVNVEAQGKEILAQNAGWYTRTYKKGANRVGTIKAILTDLAGENKFTFPSSSARLPADLSLGRESVPWTEARNLATGLGLQLFYDGRGVCRLRTRPATPSFVFQDGDGGSLVTTPQVSYSNENLKNTVLVKGAGTIQVGVGAVPSHPLSPTSLGRNGVPRHLVEVVENSSIRSKAEATSLARATLNRLLAEQVTIAFDCIPVPFIEPGDYGKVETAQFSSTFLVSQASIPLVAGDNMTVGYLRNVSPNITRIRK